MASDAVGYDVWVVPFVVSRVPHDRRRSYHVFQCHHQPTCVGACRHHVEANTLHLARREAVALHRQQRGCTHV